MAETRAGFVALLGPPNVGKSSLLNALLGQRLAIVSAKPQTTRSRILGILPRGDAQILFLDTPGRHRGTKALNTSLNAIVDEVTRDCDLAPAEVGESVMPAALAEEALPVSARKGKGLDALLDSIVARLPISPPLYGSDDLTDRPVRFLCAELIREAAMGLLAEELPHSIAVQVLTYEEGGSRPTRIRADLLVERDSQKRIVVGQGGQKIKQIGIRARQSIEALIGAKVHLELFVKVDPQWSKSARRMLELGYH